MKIWDWFKSLFQKPAPVIPLPVPPPANVPPAPRPEAPTPSSERPPNLPASNHFNTTSRITLATEYRYLYALGTVVPAFAQESVNSYNKAKASQVQYEMIGQKMGMPWQVVACVHHMECGGNPGGGLANGQPWNKKTTMVPAGRGPFSSFFDEAVYSLTQYQTPEEWGVTFAGKNWRDPGWAFWFLESWNGFGNRLEKLGRPTPRNASAYLYSGFALRGDALYLKGKDTSDNHFDPEARSSQLGCMAFLKTVEACGDAFFS